ncbi:hypothetical protein FEM48_ZijujUnG0010900 [Ziziphus jujuba var. spinosa]|uniref:Uncharacterized protein n=1 Tax=Ziziphus jujuba var. spinosa TaxID=714518 RepID=A0A978U9Y9_ZIZJJ|nr:hypothetical protein FEM48_ZijujUnG0010900 [Ziziphus jujuba var. spinosa]
MLTAALKICSNQLPRINDYNGAPQLQRCKISVVAPLLVRAPPSKESGDLIRLKGDWDELHSVPRSKTPADHKPKGFKSSDVNQCDIDKALQFQDRDWKYLVDHATNLELHRERKIADESQSSLLTATHSAFSKLGGDVRSVELIGSILTLLDLIAIPSKAAAANSKVTTDYVNHERGSEDEKTADRSEKNINSIDQLLKHNLFE